MELSANIGQLAYLPLTQGKEERDKDPRDDRYIEIEIERWERWERERKIFPRM